MIINIRSPDLSMITHGFFYKKANFPTNLSEELDFAISNFQPKKTTLENRMKAAMSINKPTAKLLFINQIHSSKVFTVSKPYNYISENADGFVTNRKNTALCILTADCAPILFFDPHSKIIGAAHAGWRGALNGIAENTIDAMVAMGATKTKITVSLGPCISKPNYEVGQEFKARFIERNTWAKKFFCVKEKNRFLFDLPGYIIHRILLHGVKNASWINICTYNQNINFHSYRHAIHYNKPCHKRNISIISL